MTDAKICDFCGTPKKNGDLGAVADVLVVKTRDARRGNICAACCPDDWRRELFNDRHVERLSCTHEETEETTLQTGAHVVRCADCEKVFDVLDTGGRSD